MADDGILSIFGRNLDRLMTAKRVQNTDVAAITQKNSATVSRWRNGKQGIALEDVQKIADHLGVPAYLLFTPTYDSEMVLKVLKMGQDVTAAGKSEALPHLLQILAATLAWAAIPRWQPSGADALQRLVTSYDLEAPGAGRNAVTGETPESDAGGRGRKR